MRTSGNNRPSLAGILHRAPRTPAEGSAGAADNAASTDATQLQESSELGLLRRLSGTALGRRFSAKVLRKESKERIAPGETHDASAASSSASEAGEGLMEILREHLAAIGHNVSSHHDVKRLLALEAALPDDAVGALRAQVLEDPQLRGEVGAKLRHYTAEALAKGTNTPEDKLLRLEVLMLSIHGDARSLLLRAIKSDLRSRSEWIKDRLSAREVFVPQVTIGGGPQGQTIAHTAHEFGHGTSTLVIDASNYGDGNFGSVRTHLLNSETRAGYAGSSHAAFNDPMRSQNPLHGSPVQVEDLNADPYPTAADIGDAAAIGLYAAARKGTPILVNTAVAGIEEVNGKRGRYRVTMRDNTSGETMHVFTNQIIDATGLGQPSVPLKDPASRSYIDEQTARLKALSARALPDQGVMHSEDMLRATVDAPDDHILDIVRKSEGDITIVGWGDSSKTPLLRIREVAEQAGVSMRELLGTRKIVWIGPKSHEDIENGLWGPYAGLKPYFDEGLVEVQPGRLETISAVEGANQSALTVRKKDGSVTRLQSGRVILAMGMKSASESFLRKLAPQLAPEMKVPVHGDDPAFEDSALCTQLHVDGKEHDIYFVGMASGLTRPADTSYLEYFGWKTRQALQQHLFPKLGTHYVNELA
jgi:hypothetical protein